MQHCSYLGCPLIASSNVLLMCWLSAIALMLSPIVFRLGVPWRAGVGWTATWNSSRLFGLLLAMQSELFCCPGKNMQNNKKLLYSWTDFNYCMEYLPMLISWEQNFLLKFVGRVPTHKPFMAMMIGYCTNVSMTLDKRLRLAELSGEWPY